MKVNTHGLVMRGLRDIRETVCGECCGNWAYHAVLYNMRTGLAWCEFHMNDEPAEEKSEYIYRDYPDVLFIWACLGSASEQTIADMIYYAVMAYKEKTGNPDTRS